MASNEPTLPAALTSSSSSISERQSQEQQPPSLSTASSTLTETSSYDSDYEVPTVGTADLLALLLAPDLHLTLTPASFLLADNAALYRLLPLVLVALARVGQRAESRALFVDLVDALRTRLCACRGLKLRFMLLVRTGGYGDLWGVKLIHRAGCYAVARAALEVRQSSLEVGESDSVEEGSGGVDGGPGASTSGELSHGMSAVSSGSSARSGVVSAEQLDRLRKENEVKFFEKLKSNEGELVKFAMTELFHAENGLKLRDHRTAFRRIRNSFHASDVVDWIVERTGIMNREKIVDIGELLRLKGLITRVGHRKPFADDRHLYTTNVALFQRDSSCACVKTKQGQTLHCWRELSSEHAVKSVDLRLPVDIIDLQSVDFWSEGVFDNTLKKGDRFGFRLVAHPLTCQGMNIIDNIEPARTQPELPDESIEAVSQNLSLHSQVMASSFTQDLARVAVGQTSSSSGPITASSMLRSLHSIISDSTAATASADPNELSTTDVDMMSLASAGVGSGWETGMIISSVNVVKVFSSIARPMIVSLRRMIPEGDIEDDGQYEIIKPNVLVKDGDNLLQDLSTEVMFRVFNNIWARSPTIFPDPHQAPFILCYEVMPTDARRGFMEVVPNLMSLSEFNWDRWKRQFGKDPIVVDSVLRSAAGSYIGAYVVGARDRHFDNILVQSSRVVTHIDFGYVLGTSPPIDGPRFSIAPAMEQVFKELQIWHRFVKLCVKAFCALRKAGPAVVRTATMLYSRAGHDPDVVKEYIRGKNSLNVHETTPKALHYVRSQIETSSTDWKAKLKSYSHEKIDPVFYDLLAKRFPPAVLAMKVVNRLDHKADKKLAAMSGAGKTAKLAADEVLQL